MCIPLFPLLLFVFSIPANAASYKKAYRKIVEQIEKKYGIMDYSLVYIDNNKSPELVCSSGGGAISIFTYRKGKAKCLINNSSDFERIQGGAMPGVGSYWHYSAGAHGAEFYYYIPKKNMLYCRFYSKYIGNYTDEGYGDKYKYMDIFFNIKNGCFERKGTIIDDATKIVGDISSPRKNYKDLIGKYSKKEILKKLK